MDILIWKQRKKSNKYGLEQLPIPRKRKGFIFATTLLFILYLIGGLCYVLIWFFFGRRITICFGISRRFFLYVSTVSFCNIWFSKFVFKIVFHGTRNIFPENKEFIYRNAKFSFGFVKTKPFFAIIQRILNFIWSIFINLLNILHENENKFS